MSNPTLTKNFTAEAAITKRLELVITADGTMSAKGHLLTAQQILVGDLRTQIQVPLHSVGEPRQPADCRGAACSAMDGVMTSAATTTANKVFR